MLTPDHALLHVLLLAVSSAAVAALLMLAMLLVLGARRRVRPAVLAQIRIPGQGPASNTQAGRP